MRRPMLRTARRLVGVSVLNRSYRSAIKGESISRDRGDACWLCLNYYKKESKVKKN